jgi:Nucleotidyl transferase AbiEii toxin, Type IV TA system
LFCETREQRYSGRPPLSRTQREAKRTGRPTDELIQLYALECFLDRLVHSKFAETFILKGGVLLAVLDARRPTRDIDFAARAIENTTEKILSAVQTIAAISLEDGMEFDSSGASAETIREEDSNSGIRVTLGGTLSRAAIRFHVALFDLRLFQQPRHETLPHRIPSGRLAVIIVEIAFAVARAEEPGGEIYRACGLGLLYDLFELRSPLKDASSPFGIYGLVRAHHDSQPR